MIHEFKKPKFEIGEIVFDCTAAKQNGDLIPLQVIGIQHIFRSPSGGAIDGAATYSLLPIVHHANELSTKLYALSIEKIAEQYLLKLEEAVNLANISDDARKERNDFIVAKLTKNVPEEVKPCTTRT
jgi:hypothetical protein